MQWLFDNFHRSIALFLLREEIKRLNTQPRPAASLNEVCEYLIRKGEEVEKWPFTHRTLGFEQRSNGSPSGSRYPCNTSDDF